MEELRAIVLMVNALLFTRASYLAWRLWRRGRKPLQLGLALLMTGTCASAVYFSSWYAFPLLHGDPHLAVSTAFSFVTMAGLILWDWGLHKGSGK